MRPADCRPSPARPPRPTDRLWERNHACRDAIRPLGCNSASMIKAAKISVIISCHQISHKILDERVDRKLHFVILFYFLQRTRQSLDLKKYFFSIFVKAYIHIASYCPTHSALFTFHSISECAMRLPARRHQRHQRARSLVRIECRPFTFLVRMSALPPCHLRRDEARGRLKDGP